MDDSRPVLLIPDLQWPFEHKKALEFCVYLKRHYKIPDENVCNMGDETDLYHGSSFPTDPDQPISPTSELDLCRTKFQIWGSYFPKMKVCLSNHGLRIIKKATNAGLPTELLRTYQEVFKTPPGWVWREEFRFLQLKHPFRIIHGMGYSGRNGAYQAAIDSGISTAIGHLHSYAGIQHVKMMGGNRIYGFNTGCLIDEDAIAFRYGKYNRAKPCIGAGLIFNSGSTPMWIPLE
jgi:hypothetical protein